MSADLCGPAAAHPAGLTGPTEELHDLAADACRTLATRLATAAEQHDLTRQQLLAAQRDVIRLQRIGAAPSPAEYWKRSALPRAAQLVDSSMAAVVQEGHRLGEALDRFLTEHDRRCTRSDNGAEAQAVAITDRAIAGLFDAMPAVNTIHELGTWWQRRLRRTAIMRSLPELLSPGADGDRIIGRSEMSLLDRAPWCHGDRLLSAFELAHGEIRTQTELVADGLTARVANRNRRYLSPARRVTIELRR